MHVVPVHDAIGRNRCCADKPDVVHPKGRGAAQTGTVIRPVDVNENIADVRQIRVGRRVERQADMHPVCVAGRNVNSAKVILAVTVRRAELQVTKDRLAVIRHGGGTGGETDIALKIRVLHPIHRRVNAVKVINLKLIWIRALTVEVERDFHRTRSGIIAGVAGGIPNQGLKRIPEPIPPDIGDLAARVVIGANARWIERVNHKYSLHRAIPPELMKPSKARMAPARRNAFMHKLFLIMSRCLIFELWSNQGMIG